MHQLHDHIRYNNDVSKNVFDWIYIMSKCFALFHHIMGFMQDLSAIYYTEIDRTCLSIMFTVNWNFFTLKRKEKKNKELNELSRTLIYSFIKLNMFENP